MSETIKLSDYYSKINHTHTALTKAGTISANANLDDYKTEGTYTCSTDNSENIVKPFGDNTVKASFLLDVKTYSPNVVQILYMTGGKRNTYIRVFNNVWSDWKELTNNTNTATQNQDGLMSKEDKEKLNGISDGATKRKRPLNFFIFTDIDTSDLPYINANNSNKRVTIRAYSGDSGYFGETEIDDENIQYPDVTIHAVVYSMTGGEFNTYPGSTQQTFRNYKNGTDNAWFNINWGPGRYILTVRTRGTENFYASSDTRIIIVQD